MERERSGRGGRSGFLIKFSICVFGFFFSRQINKANYNETVNSHKKKKPSADVLTASRCKSLKTKEKKLKP